MRYPPAIAKYMQPYGVPICVQRRLREAEIQIRPFALIDELRRNKMKSLVPNESTQNGVCHQSRGNQAHHAQQPPVGVALRGQGITLLACSLRDGAKVIHGRLSCSRKSAQTRSINLVISEPSADAALTRMENAIQRCRDVSIYPLSARTCSTVPVLACTRWAPEIP